MNPELLKFLSLGSNEERRDAHLVAQAIRKMDELRRSAQTNENSRQLALEWYQSTSRILGSHVSFAENPAEFLKLVTDALNNRSSSFDLRSGERIIQAWSAAYRLKAKTKTGRDVSVTPPLSEVVAITGPGFDVSLTPTLFEVKRQYVALFLNHEKRPDDITERQWFHDLQHLDKTLPLDASFRATLDLVKLPWHKDPGRPPGSKDQHKRAPRKDKGKPRKNSHRKSPL